MPRKTIQTTTFPIALVILIAGCDDRVTKVAREAADRQAQQNTAMADLNKQVATGSRQLVDADAQARKAFVVVHHDLQSERSQLSNSWNSLESERRSLAGQRQTDSWLASMTTVIAGTLITVMLLGFCWLVLSSAQRDPPRAELSELIVSEVLGDRPMHVRGSSSELLTRVDKETEG
jgi:hypothetical protein